MLSTDRPRRGVITDCGVVGGFGPTHGPRAMLGFTRSESNIGIVGSQCPIRPSRRRIRSAAHLIDWLDF